MNVYALTELQARLACRVSERLGKDVSVGRYLDICDSLHIYGRYGTPEFESEIIKMRRTDWRNRTWNTSELESIFEETRAKLKEDPDCFAKGDSNAG